MTEQATDTSFPTRERGLKFTGPIYVTKRNVVVPHAGTWIEIGVTGLDIKGLTSRSPRGNVD